MNSSPPRGLAPEACALPCETVRKPNLWRELLDRRWRAALNSAEAELVLHCKRQPTSAHASNPLSETERQALADLAQGFSNMQIASAHAVSEATISRRVDRGLTALQLSRTSVPICSRVLSQCAVPSDPATLSLTLTIRPRLCSSWSKAESDVILLAFSGWSPMEIAATRGRSVVTIRKQLRSAVIKAGYVDVCELAASVALSTWCNESLERRPPAEQLEHAIFDYC